MASMLKSTCIVLSVCLCLSYGLAHRLLSDNKQENTEAIGYGEVKSNPHGQGIGIGYGGGSNGGSGYGYGSGGGNGQGVGIGYGGGSGGYGYGSGGVGSGTGVGIGIGSGGGNTNTHVAACGQCVDSDCGPCGTGSEPISIPGLQFPPIQFPPIPPIPVPHFTPTCGPNNDCNPPSGGDCRTNNCHPPPVGDCPHCYEQHQGTNGAAQEETHT